MSRFKVCNWSCSAFICVAMAWSSASMAFCIPLDGGGGAICGGGMNSDNEIGSAIGGGAISIAFSNSRSEEHTSELQSRENLVCRLLLEKKKKKRRIDSETNCISEADLIKLHVH